nr:hypothetical protein BN993_03690 [Virgibacillus halodenitrificans]
MKPVAMTSTPILACWTLSLFGAASIAHAAPADEATPPVREDAPTAPQTAQSWADALELGGALRFNHRYEDWSSSDKQQGGGDIDFDAFYLDLEAEKDDLFLDLSYWFKDNDVRVLEHGFFGYRFSPRSRLEMGATFEPFGIMPYPQFGWTFNIPFYLGMGHNTALGAKYVYEGPKWEAQVGFFKNPLSLDTRYAPNMAAADDVDDAFLAPTNSGQANEKQNQLSGRLVRTFQGDEWESRLGASAYAGQLHNDTTDRNGSYWGTELHALTTFGPWQVQLQGIRYAFDPKNPEGVSDDSVLFASPGTPSYRVAAKGTVGVLNIAYDLPTSRLGPVKKLRFYNDYSRLVKDRSGWDDSQMETVGVQFFALPVMGWLDVTWGKNMNMMGGMPGGVGLASADAEGSGEWELRTNLNIGYYF